jgi:NTP pyrophosphatase (non-canonical NTP hydrolase)
MDLKAFSLANRARCESEQGFNHSIHGWTLSDWMTATVGELGEAANVIKKLNRVRDGIPGNKETHYELQAMLAEELADAFIYLDLMCQARGIDLSEAVMSKFDKTSKKIGYPIPLAIR